MTSKQILALEPEQISKLTSLEIPGLVTAAVHMDRHIKACEEIYQLYKNRFIDEAKLDAAKQGMAEVGTTWTYCSPAGEVMEVQFPKPKLISSFFFPALDPVAYRFKDKKLIRLGNLKEIAGKAFAKLFSKHYKPVDSFRKSAQELLPEKAAELITMLEEPSGPRVTPKAAKTAPTFADHVPHHD